MTKLKCSRCENETFKVHLKELGLDEINLDKCSRCDYVKISKKDLKKMRLLQNYE